MTTHTFTLNVRHDVCQTCGYAAEHELHTGDRPETTGYGEAPSPDAVRTHTPEPTTRTRPCPSTYPGAATLMGKPIRCHDAAGHVEREGTRHGNSYAARYWD